MKRRYIQDPVTLRLVPAEEYIAPTERTHLVMPDIQPYQSMIDGSMITSRSHHRRHLRDHGCIEIGNEKINPPPPYRPKGVREDILRAAYLAGAKKP